MHELILFTPGMVSLCAGCNLYEPWGALIVGAMGGAGFLAVHFCMLKLKLDDPLDAVAVHGAGGIVGVLAVPWFMVVNQVPGQRGIFWDGHLSYPWVVLGFNIFGALHMTTFLLYAEFHGLVSTSFS